MNCPTCGKPTSIEMFQSIAFLDSKPFWRCVCKCGWVGKALTKRDANKIEQDECDMYGAMGDWINKTKDAPSFMCAFSAGWEAKRDFDKAKKEARKPK